MTLDEFKAWLDGFEHSFIRLTMIDSKPLYSARPPDFNQWQLIKDKLATVEAKPKPMLDAFGKPIVFTGGPVKGWDYINGRPEAVTADAATQAIRNQNDASKSTLGNVPTPAAQATSQDWPKVPLKGAALDELWEKQLKAMAEKQAKRDALAAQLENASNIEPTFDPVRRACVDALAAQVNNASNIEPPAMSYELMNNWYYDSNENRWRNGAGQTMPSGGVKIVFNEPGMPYAEFMGKKP